MTYALISTEQYSKKAARLIKRHPDFRPVYLKILQ